MNGYGNTYTYWEVPLEIGGYFARRGNYAAAVEYLEQAYELKPDSRKIIKLLAQVYRQGNRPEEAEHMERLLETTPDEKNAD